MDTRLDAEHRRKRCGQDNHLLQRSLTRHNELSQEIASAHWDTGKQSQQACVQWALFAVTVIHVLCTCITLQCELHTKIKN